MRLKEISNLLTETNSLMESARATAAILSRNYTECPTVILKNPDTESDEMLHCGESFNRVVADEITRIVLAAVEQRAFELLNMARARYAQYTETCAKHNLEPDAPKYPLDIHLHTSK